MKIIEYKIIRNDLRHPQLEIKHEYKWNGKDFKSYDNIVQMMKDCFDMHKLNEEYVYVLSFDFDLNLLGVFELSHGTTKISLIENKELYTYLLLSGAEEFVVLHNHPSGTLDISNDDKNITSNVNAFSAIMNIKMLESIIVSKNGYKLIMDEQLNEFRELYKNKR